MKSAVEKIYKHFSNSNPSVSILFKYQLDKVFDAAYYANYSRFRPRVKMLNFNNLVDIKEGWLPEDTTEKKIEEPQKEELKKNEGENMIKRKRGRPKKIEIFKNENPKAK